MTLTILLALFGSMPTDEITGVVTDEVDRVHVNHFYDDEGRHVFDQVLFQERTPSGFRTQAWRLLKSESQYPSGGMMLWHDGETMRRVNYRMRTESWSQFDPELRERSTYPKEHRRGLTTQRNEPSESDLP